MQLYHEKNNFFKYKNIKSIKVSGEFKEKHPLISIVIPTYKKAQYLSRAIDSALRQFTDNDYYIIVVDNDCSDDSTIKDIIYTYDDKRIIFFKNEENIGMFGNWNRCIELAPTEWVVMLHDDDILHPLYLQNIFIILQYKNQFDGIAVPLYRTSCPERYIQMDFEKEIYKMKLEDMISWYPAPVGLCLKKDVAIELGGYDDSEYPCSDLLFINKLVGEKKIYLFNQFLYLYRLNENTCLNFDVQEKVIAYYHKVVPILVNKCGINHKWKSIISKGIIKKSIKYFKDELGLSKENYNLLVKKYHINDNDVYLERKYHYIEKIINRKKRNDMILIKNAPQINEEVAVFGIGKVGKYFLKRYLGQYKIILLLDNYLGNKGKQYKGMEIKTIEKLKASGVKKIIITMNHVPTDVIARLNEYGYTEKDIYYYTALV